MEEIKLNGTQHYRLTELTFQKKFDKWVHGRNYKHFFYYKRIRGMSSINLITHAVIDEIGLEGLDGITLESNVFVALLSRL